MVVEIQNGGENQKRRSFYFKKFPLTTNSLLNPILS
jgi:hypothetical protein